ncbi:hypothetical protein ACFP47_01525 [Nesterenkonia lacusekhoensis]|uniref:DNA-binding phage zinc finger domain-containing protein n=1 Tax=Nesterenkonia lacusekhoensis TaxID=150832 RepID=A0ABS4T4U9_9MICC|nr:hypothetical protein [Nesterenkonia lacusekhoensis]MBP2319474.1 hypothetical protein [Nesterenkonia lacusekhoensis]
MTTEGGAHRAIVNAAGIGELGQTLAQSPWADGLGVLEAYQQAIERSITTWQPQTSIAPSFTALLEGSGPGAALQDAADATDIASLVQGSLSTETFFKAFVPPVHVAEGVGNVLEAIDITRPFREAVETGITGRIYENFLSSTEVSTWSEVSAWRLQSSFFDSVGDEHWRQLIDSVLEHYSPEELEEVAAEPEVPERLGLFHERVQEQILNAARWLEEDYPQYKAGALDGVNMLIAIYLWTWWVQLGGLLILVGGAPGLVVAAFITGTAKLYNDQRRERLGPEASRALDHRCPYCQALINMWCITLKGALPGSNARGLHAERIKRGFDQE